MKPPLRPTFLARQGYRHRRAMDAARLLPVLGLVLFLMPLFSANAGTTEFLVFVFVVWFLLILASAALSVRLSRSQAQPEEDGAEDTP